MSSDPDNEPASPSCFAHDADEAYMGFAPRAEIEAMLLELQAADVPADDRLVQRARDMLPKVRDDALYRQLSDALRERQLPASPAT